MIQVVAVTLMLALITSVAFNIKKVKNQKELGCTILLLLFFLMGLMGWLL
jgi:heme A synthase